MQFENNVRCYEKWKLSYGIVFLQHHFLISVNVDSCINTAMNQARIFTVFHALLLKKTIIQAFSYIFTQRL